MFELPSNLIASLVAPVLNLIVAPLVNFNALPTFKTV
jgi:hypothetical protein